VYTHEQEMTSKDIQELAKSVTSDELYNKCLDYGLEENLSCGCKLSELVNMYKKLPTEDLTCIFTEHGVLQSACAGNGYDHRMNREKICRAFGVLVLDKAYKNNKSVSFEIGWCEINMKVTIIIEDFNKELEKDTLESRMVDVRLECIKKEFENNDIPVTIDDKKDFMDRMGKEVSDVIIRLFEVYGK